MLLDGSQRRARLMAWQRISAVVDVGANTGQYGRRIRDGGYDGRLISFEPLLQPFAALEKVCAHDELWECHRLALGASTGEMTLNVADDNRTSSALAVLDRHVRAAPASWFVGTETVPVTSLDDALVDLVERPARLWLKIDVQGGELDVLRGAADSLVQVRVLELEVSLVPLYESGPLFDDVCSFVGARGFRAVGFESVLDDSRTGETLQLDALFVAGLNVP